MPVYERAGRLIHFIHVPKAGGTSVSKALVEEGWKRWDIEVDKQKRNPHAVFEEWSEWYSNLDIDFEFSVVRHPTTRVNSLVNHWLRWEYSNRASPFWGNPMSLKTEEGKIFMNEIGIDTLPNGNDEWVNWFKENVVMPMETLTGVFGMSESEAIKTTHKAHKNSWIHASKWFDHYFRTHFQKSSNDMTWKDLTLRYFDLWTDDSGMLNRDKNFNGIYNGPRPIPFSEFLGENTHVFRIEDGLDSVAEVLKERKILKESIGRHNVSMYKFSSSKDTLEDLVEVDRLLKKIYERDYEFYFMFGKGVERS